jgi:hypothetical protein
MGDLQLCEANMAKDFQLKIRVEPDEYEQLRLLAKDDGERPISAYARNVLREWLKTHRPKTRIRA